MEAIFPDAAHGVYVYHLAQNLKRFCKQRNDVIWLYYRATYAYRIEDFDRIMGELKETYRKVYVCNQIMRTYKRLRTNQTIVENQDCEENQNVTENVNVPEAENQPENVNVAEADNLAVLIGLAEICLTGMEVKEDYWRGMEPSSKQLHKNKRKRYHGLDELIKRRHNLFDASPCMRTTRHIHDRPDLSPPPLDETHSPLRHPSLGGT
ncbi:hypothetical protein LWI29_025720 [Acer saccharum]|uniref:Uncharacterized protein n=1 Tax=Acer saccharum TaxID=4024 RepID=A0AA39RXR3_ACESA|nr:hypothetical protein LWI29_025720 [Acer saccharum]